MVAWIDPVSVTLDGLKMLCRDNFIKHKLTWIRDERHIVNGVAVIWRRLACVLKKLAHLSTSSMLSCADTSE